MVILLGISFSEAYMHYAQSCNFVHLHEFNVSFARPLSLTSKGDKETLHRNKKLESSLQMLLVLKLCQLATAITFKHTAIK
jgi:hypothetical protein